MDEALNPDEDSPIQVSLSLERPAKPKSRVAQAKPVAVAVAAPVKGGKARENQP
ncbi:MAG: hypothetical protein HC895_26340, partial [Leptolyngbyaceae cyanobacterium SM1_3_5]|nr:hypothetical protein [Leptolyngbyaceae cyanobacterium SM1_3_5]